MSQSCHCTLIKNKMKNFNLVIVFCLALMLFNSLFSFGQEMPKNVPYQSIEPLIVTDTVKWDTDDPAIWINSADSSKSLIIGTDKNIEGALYAFNLEGKIVKIYKGLERPNNVDITYGFPYKEEYIDIAVVTERLKQRIRVFKLPDLEPIDCGDMIVFDGEKKRKPMGIALYKRKEDGSFFVFVSGKSGPNEGYLGQYLLKNENQDRIKIIPVRQFGKYSGEKEIEAIAVDEELGYVYYSDETVGVRKYHADPEVDDANKELALFASYGFAGDQEGISIYKNGDGTGYIIVSDQQANQFWIFRREGLPLNPHEHSLLKIIKVSAKHSDGNDVVNLPLPGFPFGLFVVMSDDKTFHYYSCEDFVVMP